MNRHHGILYIVIAKFASKNFPLWHVVFDRYEDAIVNIRKYYPEKCDDCKKNFVIKAFTKTAILNEVKKYHEGQYTKFYINPAIERVIIDAVMRKFEKQCTHTNDGVDLDKRKGLVKLEDDGLFHAFIDNEFICTKEKLGDAVAFLKERGIRRCNMSVSYTTQSRINKKTAYRNKFKTITGFTPQEFDTLRKLRDKLRIVVESIEKLPSVSELVDALGDLNSIDSSLLSLSSIGDDILKSKGIFSLMHRIISDRIDKIDTISNDIQK